MTPDFLKISPRITVLPVIHGSGDCALEVRRRMLEEQFDCVAVPLPPSFQHDVERAIEHLPAIMVVTQSEPQTFAGADWTPDQDADDDAPDGFPGAIRYVPIVPSQPVIAALRIALQEGIPRAFIALETAVFEPRSTVLPDPYALKQVSLAKFAAAVLPAIPRLPPGQSADRVVTMAANLRRQGSRFRAILLVVSILDWPWIKDAYFSNKTRHA